MREYNDDKSPTIEFETVVEEVVTQKPQQNRSENDEFTAARKSKTYETYERKEKSNAALIGIASALTVLLVVAIVVGIFIIKSDKEQTQNEGTPVSQSEPEKEPEKEEIPEIQNLTIACNFVFSAVGIRENNGEYKLRADLYDQEMYRFESRDVIVDDNTDIRQDGKRLTPQALVYLIENTGGESIVFSGEIQDEDGRAISLSFETPVIEEPQEGEIVEEEETTSTEETPPAETSPETGAETVAEETTVQ